MPPISPILRSILLILVQSPFRGLFLEINSCPIVGIGIQLFKVMADSTEHSGIALVIGVGEYRSPKLSNLPNAVHDANAMRFHLVACNYDVKYLENPSVTDIKAGIRTIQIAVINNSYRNVIIYFAGHGLFDEDAHYLIPPEYDNSNENKNEIKDQLNINAIKAEEILDLVCSIEPDADEERAVVLILDTCRELLPGRERGRGDGSTDLLNEPQTLFNLCKNARIGTLVSYACDVGERAIENGGNGHGLYTEHILEELMKPGQHIIEALGRASQTVWHHQNSMQQPRMESNFPHMFNFSLVEANTGI